MQRPRSEAPNRSQRRYVCLQRPSDSTVTVLLLPPSRRDATTNSLFSKQSRRLHLDKDFTHPEDEVVEQVDITSKSVRRRTPTKIVCRTTGLDAVGITLVTF